MVWLTPVALYSLWRRFERTTDVEAARLTGDAKAVLDAPMKVAEFNALSLYIRRLEARFFPNRNVSEPTPTSEVPTKPHAPERLVSG